MALDIASTALESGQAILGTIQTLVASGKVNKILKQRKSYVTPDEIYKILQGTEFGAQGDTKTRDFQIGELNKSFSSLLGTAERLGGDPNDFAGYFDQVIKGQLKIGDEFHKSNMEWFGKYLDAESAVAANKAAEQKSQQDLLKDKIAAAAGDKAAGVQNVGNAINSFIGTQSADGTSDLYKKIANILNGNKNNGNSSGGDRAGAGRAGQ